MEAWERERGRMRSGHGRGGGYVLGSGGEEIVGREDEERRGVMFWEVVVRRLWRESGEDRRGIVLGS